MTFRKAWGESTRTRTGLRSQSQPKVKKKQTGFSTDFQPAGRSKCQWRKVPGVPTLQCSGTSTGLSGRWNFEEGREGGRRRHGGTEARRHGGTEARRHGGTEARRGGRCANQRG